MIEAKIDVGLETVAKGESDGLGDDGNTAQVTGWNKYSDLPFLLAAIYRV